MLHHVGLSDQASLTDVNATRAILPWMSQINRIELASKKLGIPEEILQQAEWWSLTPDGKVVTPQPMRDADSGEFVMVGAVEEGCWEMRLDKHSYRVHYAITHDDVFHEIDDWSEYEVA